MYVGGSVCPPRHNGCIYMQIYLCISLVFFMFFFERERERVCGVLSWSASFFFSRTTLSNWCCLYCCHFLAVRIRLGHDGLTLEKAKSVFFSLLPLSHCWRWLEFNQVCSYCISLGALGVEFHFSLTGEWCQMLCSSRPIQIFRWLKLKLRHSRGYNAMISSMWWDTLAESWNGQQ